ncbi:hypothetical protein DCC85_21805 [Paenibacillus sp. CAA11]|uniref:DUF4073 domain-containing protein n=1 Tax=Paenibacillus sp. CAA11 TaxID=1532905 RepID=UPI000D38F6DD|nr:DUF4073 domain-containing protein [Paenibacillus sp. CAA11]AWB46542.1 hypothetical protein DCC85_21805 [Paenibacillus sp. CAA11]
MTKKYRYLLSLLLVFALVVQMTPAAFATALSPLDRLNQAKSHDDRLSVMEALRDPELAVSLPTGSPYWSDDLMESIVDAVMYTIEGDYASEAQVQFIVNVVAGALPVFENMNLTVLEDNLNGYFGGLVQGTELFPNDSQFEDISTLGESFVTMSAVDKQIFAYMMKFEYLRMDDRERNADSLRELLSMRLSSYNPINKVKDQTWMYNALVNLRLLQKEANQFNDNNSEPLMDAFGLNLDKVDDIDFAVYKELAQWMIDHRPAEGYPDYAAVQQQFNCFFVPCAPKVTADDTENTLVGADSTMEFSTDSGANWTAYDPEHAPVFTGNVTVQIRVKATYSKPSGDVTTVHFTETETNPDPIPPSDGGTTPTPDPTPNPSPSDGGGSTSPVPSAPSSGGGSTSPAPSTPFSEGGNSVISVPSSSPSTSSPSTQTENIVVDVNGGDGTNLTKTPITRTTDSQGTVKDLVTLSEQIAKDAVQKAEQLKLDTASIVIPDPNDKVSEVKVILPQAALKQLNEGGLKLEIETANGVISVPSASLTGFADDLYFRIVPVKAAAQQKEIEDRAKQERVIQAAVQNSSVQVLGRPMQIETNMQSREVSIVLPLKDSLPQDTASRQEMLNNLGIYIEHSDGTKELVQGKLVKMKDGQEGIQFTVHKFSTFTLVYLDGWKDDPYIQGHNGNFYPDAFVTRAQMAAMLARNTADEQEAGAAQAAYTDVNNDYWAYNEIVKVQRTGIMTGAVANTFDPEASITRAQMAAIAQRWLKQQDASAASTGSANYKDVQAGYWAAEAIAFVKSSGIMVGYEDNTFRPDQKLTRAEAVKVLNRLFNRTTLTEPAGAAFKDVPATHWAFKEIEAAATRK